MRRRHRAPVLLSSAMIAALALQPVTAHATRGATAVRRTSKVGLGVAAHRVKGGTLFQHRKPNVQEHDQFMKLKIPTDGGNPGPYNGRSYDGLYLLQGRWQTGLETIPAHQAGMAQAPRHHLRQALRLHSEPGPCSASPVWSRWRVRLVAACAGFEAEIEVTDIFSGRG